MIVFGVSGIVEVVVSLFTPRVPIEELGGLTWPTIDNRPIAQGAIGEDQSTFAEGGNKYELPQVTQQTTKGSEIGKKLVKLFV